MVSNIDHSSSSQAERELISLILDKFAMETKMPIGLFPIGVTFTSIAPESGLFPVVSNDSMSDFCQTLRSYPKGKQACDEDHIRRANQCKGYRKGKMWPCPRGLYNIHYPIYFDGEFVGALLAGQRKLKGYGGLSTDSLRNELSVLGLENDEINKLTKLYEGVPTVAPKAFREPVFDQIRLISGTILEVVRTRLAFEYRITNLLHEWLSLTQLITAGADRLNFIGQSEGKIDPRHLTNISNELAGYIKILVSKAENVRHSMLFRGQSTYSFVPVKVVPQLNSIIDLLRPIAARKDIELEPVYSVGGADNFIEIADQYFDRAIVNLYDNAIKYSYEGSHERHLYRFIRTVVNFKLDKVYIDISNYGIGIKPHEMERVKLEGERGEESFDRNRTGSGLGLSEAIKIAENHNGSLSIKSIVVDRANKKSPYLTNITISLPYVHKKGGGLL